MGGGAVCALVSTIAKCVFTLLPPTLLLILPRPLRPPACVAHSCHAFGLRCPVPEVTFPSTPPTVSCGVAPSPAQRRWTGHSMAVLVGVAGLWYPFRGFILSCMESIEIVAVSPSRPWSMLLSQAVGGKARKAALSPEMMEGAV